MFIEHERLIFVVIYLSREHTDALHNSLLKRFMKIHFLKCKEFTG